MNIEEAREYCLTLKNTIESQPFGEDSVVFKVEDKMFLLLPLDISPAYISVKCDPEQALVLRERYQAVAPAWHFHKKYWNAIELDNDMSDEEIRYWIDHSYRQVIAKLPKKIRDLYND